MSRKNKPILKRKYQNRGEPKQSFLIVCEGEKTEPNYFKKFRLSSARVEIMGCGANTDSLIKKTKEIEKAEGIKYDQVWCVFDRDCNPRENFNLALNLAEKHKINVAYSVESFELWYLLHFQYLDTGIRRSDYINKLNAQLNKPYKKNDEEMYNTLIDKQNTAIQNAKKLLAFHSNEAKIYDRNPSTTVHLLVEELNKYLKKY